MASKIHGKYFISINVEHIFNTVWGSGSCMYIDVRTDKTLTDHLIVYLITLEVVLVTTTDVLRHF